MSLTPVVYPGVDAQGVETSPVITALFDQAIESGSLDKAPIVLIKKETEFSDNQIKNIPVSFEFKRIDLSSVIETSALDYGDGASPGKEYRSRIEISPKTPLEENSQYSVIIPKELSLLSTFDPRPAAGNSSPLISFKGAYTGFMQDEYEVSITSDGSQSRCYYQWKRLSDNHTESGLRGRRRFIELERGLFVMFPDGEYKAGDSFTVKVRPEAKIGKLFTWDFATGNHNHAVPEDEDSNSSVNLPVTGGDSQVSSGSGFFVQSIQPELADSLVPIGAYASLSIGSITLKTKEMTDLYNKKEVEITNTAAAGAETLNIVGDTISVGIEEGTTTNQQIVDLINGSVLNSDIEALTLLPSNIALVGSRKFSKGVPRNTVTITFSKNIDPASIQNDTIKLFAENLLEYTRRELSFEHSVQDNILTIKIIEE